MHPSWQQRAAAGGRRQKASESGPGDESAPLGTTREKARGQGALDKVPPGQRNGRRLRSRGAARPPALPCPPSPHLPQDLKRLRRLGLGPEVVLPKPAQQRGALQQRVGGGRDLRGRRRRRRRRRGFCLLPQARTIVASGLLRTLPFKGLPCAITLARYMGTRVALARLRREEGRAQRSVQEQPVHSAERRRRGTPPSSVLDRFRKAPTL